ncbi:transcription factor grauzone-like [Toxorhynchites rutilus septentrionalis]|uniref:transcription factor grauzone-like n=1 Tax=Toxorhynchites rutilus septentrionalis TaxID=329112 RepID=UPI002479DF54|nr:transcription factor grauzone-like [Toxorhynchites rutilus septentrionalis]
MSSFGLEGCFTCLRQTENFHRITDHDDVSGENIEAIFAQHFWFTKDDYRNRIVCTSCWEKIDEFHKFYCHVEKIHGTSQLAEIKSEPSTEEIIFELGLTGKDVHDDECDKKIENPEEEKQLSKSLIFCEPICELATEQSLVAGNENESEINGDGDGTVGNDFQLTDSSDESSSVSSSASEDIPLVRRLATRKRKRTEETKGQHVFTCHICIESGVEDGEKFRTFYRLNAHFKKEHNMNGYIFCCSRRWSSRKAFVEHFDNHEATKVDQKRCLECNCLFNNESSYAKHMYLVHTPEDQKQFRCDRCSKAFAAEDLLNSHINWHEEVEKKNHHCPMCNKYFFNAGYLKKHNLSHHKISKHAAVTTTSTVEKVLVSKKEEIPKKRKRGTPADVAKQDELIRGFITLSCSKCDFIGQTFKELSEHALVVHQLTTPSVVCCDRRFGKRLRLYEHCLRHLNPDHFKCELCGKAFTDSSGLQHHKWWIHTPVSERPFKCDICGDAFVKDYLLKQHMDRHMDKERKTHSCELCNKTYTNSLQLKSHMQKLHGAVSNWVCDVCAKGFTHRALLEDHRKTHTEEGLASLKMQCEKCNKWLINKRGYLRHKRRCFDNGPATCDVCGVVSVNEASLAAHKKLHHSHRPKFTCTYCGKEFKKQLRLKEHEASHAGIVLYKCPYCPRMCNSSSNMYTHKKTAHPEQWAEAMAARDGPS